MKIFIGVDHAGFEIKSHISDYLLSQNIEVVDLGVYSKDRVDYPDIAKKVCSALLESEDSFGILVCGSGIGMSIAANKFKGIRAALCHDGYSAKMCRAHNDANVLCLGQRVVGVGVVESIIDNFLDTKFEGGRHSCRVGKIE